MVLDRARGRVVLFGGGRCCTGDCFYLGWCNKGDTWEWSGQQWDIVHVPHPPPGRMRHAMTYDEIRSQVVLFGGGIPSSDFDGSGLFLDGDQQTWVYDGDSWTPVADAGPSPRWRHAMAYDANRGVTVLFGGEDTADDERRFHGDTWEWDGEHWGLVTSDGPSPRSGHAMTYDRRRRGVLLLGGDDGVAYPSTQLWIYRVDPSLPDCNQNHVDDREDLFAGRSADSNGNGIPDECE